MKSFLFKILSFTVFVIFTYVILTIIVGYSTPSNVGINLAPNKGVKGYLNLRLNEVDTIKNVDILFLGNSRSYRGFDPRIFKNAGYSSFNLGSSAQVPIQTKILLKRYLDRLNPKLVVYEISPISFNGDGVHPIINLLANDEIDYYNIEMVVEANNITVFNTYIWQVFDSFFNDFNDKSTLVNEKGLDTYISGGYVMTERENYQVFGEKKLDYYRRRVNSVRNFSTFEENLSILKERGYPFILVNTPTEREFYNRWIKNDVVDSLLSKSGPYYDFNENYDMPDSVSYFYDASHLNQKGVDRFNRDLIDRVIDPFFYQQDQ